MDTKKRSIKISRRKFVSSRNAKKFRWGTLSLSKKVLVSKSLLDWRGERDGVSRFSAKNILSLRAVNFRTLEETFCACFRNLSLAKKFLDNMGEYRNFPPKVFRLTMPKNLVSEAYRVSLISEIEFFFLRGLCRDFLSELSCLALPKKSVKDPSVLRFRKITVPIFLEKRGGV